MGMSKLSKLQIKQFNRDVSTMRNASYTERCNFLYKIRCLCVSNESIKLFDQIHTRLTEKENREVTLNFSKKTYNERITILNQPFTGKREQIKKLFLRAHIEATYKEREEHFDDWVQNEYILVPTKEEIQNHLQNEIREKVHLAVLESYGNNGTSVN